jgi:hypothetical protein
MLASPYYSAAREIIFAKQTMHNSSSFTPPTRTPPFVARTPRDNTRLFEGAHGKKGMGMNVQAGKMKNFLLNYKEAHFKARRTTNSSRRKKKKAQLRQSVF